MWQRYSTSSIRLHMGLPKQVNLHTRDRQTHRQGKKEDQGGFEALEETKKEKGKEEGREGEREGRKWVSLHSSARKHRRTASQRVKTHDFWITLRSSYNEEPNATMKSRELEICSRWNLKTIKHRARSWECAATCLTLHARKLTFNQFPTFLH